MEEHRSHKPESSILSSATKYDSYAVKSVTLTKEHFGTHQHISRELLDDCGMVKFEQNNNWILDGMLFTLHAYMWGEGLQTKVFITPRTWWDRTKERWFPKWALKRWPVEYEKTVWEAKALYPDFGREQLGRQHIVIIQTKEEHNG